MNKLEKIDENRELQEDISVPSYEDRSLDQSELLQLNSVHRQETLLLWPKLKEYNEQIFIAELIEVLESSRNERKLIKQNYSDDKLKLTKMLKMEFLSLVEKIWVIIDHVNIPLEKRVLCKWTLKTINDITSNWGKMKIWTNCYFVPWSLQSLKRLNQKQVLDYKDVEIKFWLWVNLQESIWLIKAEANWHENYMALNRFEENKDKVKRIHIHLWDNSSMAHGASIVWKEISKWEFEINLHASKWVFLWINSVIWSWSDFWSNSVLWWWSKVWFDVKIWNNTIIWAWANIKDWVEIPDNSIVLDWSHIEKWFELVSFEDYKANEVLFDMTKINSKNKRNFVIKLSEDKVERKKQIEQIWISYKQMSVFNKWHVTPDNKAFSVIDVILWFLNEKYKWLDITKNIIFQNLRSEEEINDLSNWTVKKDKTNSEIYLQAYLKNKIDFIQNQLIHILKRIQDWDSEDIESIKLQLDYPKIPDSFKKIFLWYTSMIWDIKIWDYDSSLIVDCYFRADEKTSKTPWQYNNVVFNRWVFHWWWIHDMTWVKWFRTCFHGNIIAEKSNIWEIWYPSIYNNVDLSNFNSKWRCTVNNVCVKDSTFWFAVVVSTSPEKKVIIQDDSYIWDNSTIRWNNEFVNYNVFPNSFIWEPNEYIKRMDWNISWLLVPHVKK